MMAGCRSPLSAWTPWGACRTEIKQFNCARSCALAALGRAHHSNSVPLRETGEPGIEQTCPNSGPEVQMSSVEFVRDALREGVAPPSRAGLAAPGGRLRSPRRDSEPRALTRTIRIDFAATTRTMRRYSAASLSPSRM